MDQSFFLKCEKCSLKPATIRLHSGAQEKKVCFGCERDLVREAPYKDWNKQFIPYSDLKRSNISESKVESSKPLSVSRIEGSLRSPVSSTPSYSHRNNLISSHREKGEKLSESMLLKSPLASGIDSVTRSRGVEAVSPKVGIGKKSYEVVNKPPADNESASSSQTGMIRPNTPKKNVFYSDYLKDYNPKSSIGFKSPSGASLKKEIIDRTARSYSSTSFVNPLNSSRQTKLSENTKERTSVLDNKPLNSHRLEQQIETPKQEIRGRISGRKEVKFSPERPVESTRPVSIDDHDRKLRDAKKDDIKSRISKLSEQYLSPIKAPVVNDARVFTTDETLMSLDLKDNKIFRRDYAPAQRESIERLSVRKSTNEDEGRTKGKGDEPAEDFKHKLAIQTYEANIASLKAHLDAVEKRNGETITRLREELRQVKEDLLKEKTGNSSQGQKEVVHLNEKIGDLEKRIKEEIAKNKQLEERNEQNKVAADKKVADIKEELEKTKKEKDKKIEELNNQIKSLNKTHRDATDKIHKENEAFVKKLKNEYELVSRDLNKQVENKTQDAERLKEEKESALRNMNHKISTLQENLKFQQDINTKLRQNGDVKVEEEPKYTQKTTSTKPKTHFRSGMELPSQDTS